MCHCLCRATSNLETGFRINPLYKTNNDIPYQYTSAQWDLSLYVNIPQCKNCKVCVGGICLQLDLRLQRFQILLNLSRYDMYTLLKAQCV